MRKIFVVVCVNLLLLGGLAVITHAQTDATSTGNTLIIFAGTPNEPGQSLPEENLVDFSLPPVTGFKDIPLTGNSKDSVAPVPEPSTFFLIGLGGLLLLLLTQGKKRRGKGVSLPAMIHLLRYRRKMKQTLISVFWGILPVRRSRMYQPS